MSSKARFQFSVQSLLIAVLLLTFAIAIATRNLSQGTENPRVFSIVWLMASLVYTNAFLAFRTDWLLARESGVFACLALVASLLNLFITSMD